MTTYCQQSGCPGNLRPEQEARREAVTVMHFPNGEIVPTCSGCAPFWRRFGPPETPVQPEPRPEGAEIVLGNGSVITVPRPEEAVPAPAAPRPASAGPRRDGLLAVLMGRNEADPGAQHAPAPPGEIPAPYTPPRRQRIRNTILLLVSGIVLTVTGVPVFIQGANAPAGVNGSGDTQVGVLMVLSGLVLLALPVLIGAGRFVRNERRGLLHKMTPEQRRVYYAAETAAMFAGAAALHHRMHEQHVRESARLSRSVMYGREWADVDLPLGQIGQMVRQQEQQEAGNRLLQQLAQQQAGPAPWTGPGSHVRPHHPWDDPRDWAW